MVAAPGSKCLMLSLTLCTDSLLLGETQCLLRRQDCLLGRLFSTLPGWCPVSINKAVVQPDLVLTELTRMEKGVCHIISATGAQSHRLLTGQPPVSCCSPTMGILWGI